MLKETIKTRVIGVDISLECTMFAIVDIRGNIIAKGTMPTEGYSNINHFIAVLCEKLIELMTQNGGYETIRSIGISAPSSNFRTGCMENAVNMPWKGVIPIAAMLRDQLGIAVALGNDAHTIALGEHAFGAGHGLKDFMLVILASGMGSCIYSDGDIYLGSQGFAGEIGHTCIVPDGRECGCGRRGCLETYCAAKGIIRTAREMMDEDSSKTTMMRHLDHLSPRTIVECCEAGDKMAIEVMRRTGYMLGLGLANYASVVDPEAIIFSGGISKAGHWLFDPAEESFEQHVFHNMKGRIKFMTSTLNPADRDVLGASALAWQVKEYSLFK